MNLCAVEKYYEKDFLPVMSQIYEEVKTDIRQKEIEIKKKWMEQLDQIFTHIHQKQKEGKLEPIRSLCFVYLRTRYLEKDYRYAVNAYGENWYAGEEYPVGNLDVSFFFQYHEKAMKKLQKEAKKYFGKVRALDVERILQEETGRNLYFMQSLFRKWKEEICQLESFGQMQKNPYFRMELGEYYEPGIYWYLEKERQEEQKEKRKIAKDRNHCCRDYRGINIDGMELVSKEFVDTRFCGAGMRNSRWLNCAVQGADFREAVLAGAYFFQCVMQESIWRNSDFRDALFEECMMYSGEKISLRNFWPDYEPIQMEECCLCGAKFVRCVMNGLDFSKADITGCTFEECVLLGCTFTEEQVRQHNLSVEKWKLHVKTEENIMERSIRNGR